jgi:hypothetical protein
MSLNIVSAKMFRTKTARKNKTRVLYNYNFSISVTVFEVIQQRDYSTVYPITVGLVLLLHPPPPQGLLCTVHKRVTKAGI